MANLDTPRRQRRGWNLPRNEERVSLKAVLHSSIQDTSIVISEASTPRKHESEDLKRYTKPRGVAWDVSMADYCNERPDPSLVSSLNDGRKRTQMRHGHSRVQDLDLGTADVTGVRRNAVSESGSNAEDSIAKLRALRPKRSTVGSGVRNSDTKSNASTEQGTNVATSRSKGAVARDSLKRIMSGTRARQKLVKSRKESFAHTIDLLSSSNSVFHRAEDLEEDATPRQPEELCVIEVQQAAFDRWEKAISVARQALEEAMEAERVLNFAAEFEQLKGTLETRTEDWDLGVDSFLTLYRSLQEEYPETAPIKPSRIQRHRRRGSMSSNGSTSGASLSSGAQLNNNRRVQGKQHRSSIPSRSQDTSSDPNVMRALGRRFAHAAECWFLRLVNHLVGTDFHPSVYCREDCYSLMSSLKKVQNWLLHAKGRSRVDRNEALLSKLRETIIQWSSKMIRLPPGKTIMH